MTGPLFLVSVAEFGNPVAPFVLSLDGFPSLARAERGREWQSIGQGRFTDWRICRRVGPAEFRCVRSGQKWTAERYDRLPEVWDAFLASWSPNEAPGSEFRTVEVDGDMEAGEPVTIGADGIARPMGATNGA